MPLILESIYYYNDTGAHDKIYIIQLIDDGEDNARRYRVHRVWGPRGRSLQIGDRSYTTRTDAGVDWENTKRQRIQNGYREVVPSEIQIPAGMIIAAGTYPSADAAVRTPPHINRAPQPWMTPMSHIQGLQTDAMFEDDNYLLQVLPPGVHVRLAIITGAVVSFNAEGVSIPIPPRLQTVMAALGAQIGDFDLHTIRLDNSYHAIFDAVNLTSTLEHRLQTILTQYAPHFPEELTIAPFARTTAKKLALQQYARQNNIRELAFRNLQMSYSTETAVTWVFPLSNRAIVRLSAASAATPGSTRYYATLRVNEVREQGAGYLNASDFSAEDRARIAAAFRESGVIYAYVTHNGWDGTALQNMQFDGFFESQRWNDMLTPLIHNVEGGTHTF